MAFLQKYKEIISGLVFVVFSITAYFYADSIRVFAPNSGNYINAQFFPKVISFMLGLVSVYQVIVGIRQLAKTAAVPCDAHTMSRTAILRIVATLILLMIYVALLESLGFLIMTVLYIFFQVLILTPRERINYPFTIGLSVVFSGLVYFMFTQVFSLMLPRAEFLPF